MSAPPPVSAAQEEKEKEAKDKRDRALLLGSFFHDVTGQTRTKRRREHIFANYTEFAKKYGHPRGISRNRDHTILKYTGKSGLTPLSPGVYSESLPSPREIRRRRGAQRLRDYQRSILTGFTTDELNRMESLPATDTREKKQRLSGIPIHPLLAQKQWLQESELPKHQGNIYTWGDMMGAWNAHNPVVWRLLKPILELVTLILTYSADNEWLDALFNGTYEDLPEQQGMGPSRRFLPRSTQQRIADNSSPTIQQRLIDMKKNVRFGIDSGHQAAMHPLPVRSTSRYGETLSAPWLGHIGVWISLETLQPLLRNDLTDVEVLAVRIQICVTIIHELAHAAYKSLVMDSFKGVGPKLPQKEPYFQNEPLVELGYSFTANIFGGFNTPMLSPTRSCGGPGLPPFGMFQASFFTWRALDYGQNKGHRRPASQLQSTVGPDPFDFHDQWAVTTDWHTKIATQEFWDDKVRSGGLKALEIGPLKYGIRLLQGAYKYQPIHHNMYGITTNIESFEAILHGNVDVGQPEPQQQAVIEENKRFEKGQQIMEAMEGLSVTVSDAMEKEDMAQFDSDLDPEDRIETVSEAPPLYLGSSRFSQPCQRYDEIKAFLVANRAEQKLAIDNMEIISDAAFYRYIRDFGGIKLDIHEFKAFLSKCFENQELFIWCPFPNPGVVKRVPTGWPEPPVYVNERQLEDKNFIPDEKEREKLEYLLEEPRVQEKLYSSLKELRDLDINIFRDMFWVLKTSELMSKSDKALLIASEERFRDLVVSVAGAPDGSGIKSIVLGPKGIVRFAYPVDDYRDKYITPNMKSLLVLFEKTEMKWNAGWEANLKRKKERER